MAPTPNEVRERLYQTFETDWGATSPFTFVGESFEPPFNVDWVRFGVAFNFSDQATLGTQGNRKFLRGGGVTVQCFQPIDTGTGRAGALAKIAADIFEGKTIGVENVQFRESTVVDIGEGEFWYQVNALAIFDYEEIR